MNLFAPDLKAETEGEELWERVRAQYPAQEPLLNLNNAAVSPPTIAVQEATIDAYRFISRNPDYNMWSNLDAALPGIKRDLAELIDCTPDEIALNRNSSEGLSAAIFGIPLTKGDQVLISNWDYPSVRAGWLQRHHREGIEVVNCAFDIMDSDEDIIDAYVEAMTPRTCVLQLTHMYHWNGRVLPIERLCRIARERNIITIVDGAQTFAQMPVSFRQLDCDFFVTSLHKWLGAPVGNGMLIVNRSQIDRTWPLLAPFDQPAKTIDKFDHWNLGTYNSAIQAGIKPAIQFHREIGADRMHVRLRELTRHWVGQARDIPGFRLHTRTDTESLGAICLFSIDNTDMKKLENTLREKYRIHTKYRQVEHVEGLRVSPHIYMLKSDLDMFVSALRNALA
ncbi:aminotransferase class V-fold PLP-dependent enzyme (plasmid) [Rhizobium leguminosarum]|uniref:aminotransferase class V-fold PLP-dependent enzyme n=1 Tax=Rhizobium TaxID=379 RepID=UPI000647C8E1|nr:MULTISPECIES: aminotransferase class V-fold PLP-dependent enzyme [Rhizobium]MBP2491571.1 selenocysteine lyase/cysteine desulfurase [Rhizobium leguminosarum]MCJ9690753.1 aminotransferase class V-fold PLP-dependent enzyme [Rhizobium sp. PRIMUS64]NKK03196.1 aminotransferase class V-fold PLP-dependent enzyme [Rhizobium leguminosarum bv. viciae]WHO83102.1 aminotransferase class V-fold PLP-dependent enzyme [Rhizobium leguminosarum]